MSRPSTVAARCAALGTSIAQVIPDISTFARKVRHARHDLNTINTHLLVIKTALGIAQDDFSATCGELPPSLVDAVSRVLDSCDDTSERLHKAFVKLSCSRHPKDDWRTLKDGPLVNLRHDLDASKVVLELALDYITLFAQQDTIDSLVQNYVSGSTAHTDDLLKRTDTDEIYVNQTARDRLSLLLQAVRLLRSCITAISRDGVHSGSQRERRTTIPRPDSLEPALGETPRSGRKSPNEKAPSTKEEGIGTWLANIPSFTDAQPLSYCSMEQTTVPRLLEIPPSRNEMTPSRGTFYTDDGLSPSATLVAPESRLKKSYSWCTDLSGKASTKLQLASKHASRHASRYTSTLSGSDISIFHKKITSDKIAITKAKRKELGPGQRAALDRILTNIPSEATAAEVERVIWEGANPMAAHPEFGYFFIRAAYEMSPDILTLLMEFGADITHTNSAPGVYYSAMHAATLGRQLETVRYLASLGHSIDCPDHNGETPLHLAVQTPGASAIAKYLVEEGVDIDFEANNGLTPIQSTLKAMRLEGRERSSLIELLLAHGAEGAAEVKRVMECRRDDKKGRSVLGIT
ncbi:Arp Ankyrin repeat [Pyrenophora teres f. maculata]|nr:Arp Ankyrin repeat [Pyrenophora teres f. maculata]